MKTFTGSLIRLILILAVWVFFDASAAAMTAVGIFAWESVVRWKAIKEPAKT